MIQVINRACDILELIARDPDTPKTLGEIAGVLDLNAGTCANIIKTLVDRQYIEKIDKQKGYCLGSMAYKLTGNEGYKKTLITAAKVELELLTKKINENSLLAQLNGSIRVAILRAHGTNDVQAVTPAEKPAYETTSGRMLIAMLPDEQRKKYVKKHGLPKAEVWEEASNLKSFEKQIKRIRTQQYAIQITNGRIVGLAVPIYNGEKVIASLGVYMPEFRFKHANKDQIIALMKEHANRISRKI